VTRGVVVGKFYPPHSGHKYLIDTAASQVDQLDVLVCWHDRQSIPGSVRKGWLAEIHAGQSNVTVHSVWDFGDDNNPEAWAQYTINALGDRPDVVFSSEGYGEAFAHHLGACHVCVDRQRRAFPVSGTLVRADPLKYWDYFEPPVQAWYALRIAVVGAESTGTTTLATALAEHYKTLWVPEYGRDYCQNLLVKGIPLDGYPWKTEEFIHIAQAQQAREDEYARRCNRVLICDTDALATGIWHERYRGTASEAVRCIAGSRSYALDVLTDCDISVVQDGLRDGEHVRQWMTRRFREELQARTTKWVCVSGTHQERMEVAVAAINGFLG